MNEGALRAMRGIMLAIAVLGTALSLVAALRGEGSLVRIVTLLPMFALAGFADWQLSGRWDGIFGAIFGSRR